MTLNYDPDRALWIPGRRRFLVMSGLALARTVLGVKPRSLDRYVITATTDPADTETLVSQGPWPVANISYRYAHGYSQYVHLGRLDVLLMTGQLKSLNLGGDAARWS